MESPHNHTDPANFAGGRALIDRSALKRLSKHVLMDRFGVHLYRRDKPLPMRVLHWISRRGRHEIKRLYQLATPTHGDDRRILLIFGCQRSGTTMMTELFGADWNAEVYPEHSILTSNDQREHLRLNPLEQVRGVLDGSHFPLVVLKPLVESQNCRDLLDYWPDASALWMYRHYQAVASSNLRCFGVANGIKNLSAVARHRHGDWRSEGVSPDVRSIVHRYFDEAMNPFDAAALFWYVRNRHFFDLDICSHPRVMLQKYENLVVDPAGEMARVYQFIQRPRPGSRSVAKVHNRAIGRGSDIRISDEVEDLCEELWADLNRVLAEQRSRPIGGFAA